MTVSDPARAAVVVVHPGLQHSRQLALALQEGGMLSRFITSIDGSACNATWLPQRLRARLRSRRTEGLPRERVISIPYVEMATWVLGRILGARLRHRLSYKALEIFDHIASSRAAATGPRIVVAFENSCRETFRKAKSAGALCVLDAASVHHSAQPEEGRDADPVLIRRIKAAKDEEIGLADHIVVLSTFARDTYAAAGVSVERISVLPPGLRLPYPPVARAATRSSAQLRFLFAGNVKYAKGIDLLLRAFSRLEIRDKWLGIAGGLAERSALPRPLPTGVEYLGKLEPERLVQAYADADVLVLPSRADGFGFVVAEAMACGVPVIVSSAVGAKDFVDNGRNGWVFESGNELELAGAMAEAAARRSQLDAMGERARLAVADLSLANYGLRIRRLYQRFLTTAIPAR